MAVPRHRPDGPTPEVVAEWAPGGSVVEYVTPTRTRFILGAWSWAGIAGLLATFDATIVEPEELKDACRTLARRYRQAVDQRTDEAPPVVR